MKEKETTNAMSCPTKSPEASARWKMILSGVIFLVLVVAVTILMIPVMRLMMQEGGKEQLIEKIQSYGIFAPLLFVLLQVIQIVVAFIPGGPIPMIGGAVFGMVPDESADLPAGNPSGKSDKPCFLQNRCHPSA